MFSNPITLTSVAASEPVNFDFAGASNGSSTYRVAPGTYATIANPMSLKVAHQVSKANTAFQTRRTVVRIDRTVGGEAGAPSAVLSAYVVLVLPERIAPVDAVTDILNMVQQLLTSGNITKIVNQEL